MSTHALGTSELPIGLRVLRHLDLALLAAALPVFVLGELPLLGYAATAVAWTFQRWMAATVLRHALESGNRRAVLGALAGGLIGRIWLIGSAVLLAGLVEREAGVAAGVLAVVLFTVYFSTTLMLKPLEEARR